MKVAMIKNYSNETIVFVDFIKLPDNFQETGNPYEDCPRVLSSNESLEILESAVELEQEISRLTSKGATEEAFIGNDRKRFYL
jgi:hypothetical protein